MGIGSTVSGGTAIRECVEKNRKNLSEGGGIFYIKNIAHTCQSKDFFVFEFVRILCTLNGKYLFTFSDMTISFYRKLGVFLGVFFSL